MERKGGTRTLPWRCSFSRPGRPQPISPPGQLTGRLSPSATRRSPKLSMPAWPGIPGDLFSFSSDAPFRLTSISSSPRSLGIVHSLRRRYLARRMARRSSWPASKGRRTPGTFYEPFGGDRDLLGPEYDGEVPAGAYSVVVTSPDNTGKYVLAVGRKEKFPPGRWPGRSSPCPGSSVTSGKPLFYGLLQPVGRVPAGHHRRHRRDSRPLFPTPCPAQREERSPETVPVFFDNSFFRSFHAGLSTPAGSSSFRRTRAADCLKNSIA